MGMVSSIVLCALFMHKPNFGLLQLGCQTRIVQVDLHNLRAIVTMTCAPLAGLTGVFLAFSPLIIGMWQKTNSQG